jgi:hypothetical protein
VGYALSPVHPQWRRSEFKDANAEKHTPHLIRVCGICTAWYGIGDVGLDAGMGIEAAAVGTPPAPSLSYDKPATPQSAIARVSTQAKMLPLAAAHMSASEW